MKNKTLKQQFIHSVDDNFHPRTNKHSYKNMKCKTIKIVSYSYRKGLINFGCNLSNFLRNEYKIKYLKEINEEHIQEFFRIKGATSTSRTLKQYKSYLLVFDKLINQTYHIKLHFDRMDITIANGDKLRDATMEEYILDEIIEENKLGDSESILGLRICRIFGIRAEEVVSLKAKDFDLEKYVLKIYNAKSGRYREIHFTSEQRYNLAQEIRMEYDDDERLVKIKSDSLNRFLSRKIQGKGIEKYKDKKTGIHSIRKMVAQNQYKANIDKGLTKRQAYTKGLAELGHGAKRDSTYEDSYLYPSKKK